MARPLTELEKSRLGPERRAWLERQQPPKAREPEKPMEQMAIPGTDRPMMSGNEWRQRLAEEKARRTTSSVRVQALPGDPGRARCRRQPSAQPAARCCVAWAHALRRPRRGDRATAGGAGQFVARLPCAECRNHLQTSPATADGGMHKQSRNRHDSDEKSSKFLADAGPLAAIGLSAFKFGHHRTLSLTALRPTAIENHLNVRVSREPLHQMIVQGRMPQSHDENVASQACSHSSTEEAAGVVLSVVLDV